MTDMPASIGKYEVLAELGRGAMGTVYKARDPVLGRLVALKTMSDALLVDEEMRERFLREARSAAGLQHPNIVTIYEFDPEEVGGPFIAMELLDGRPLSELMDGKRLTRLEDKIKLVEQVCRGLDFAHKRGVIHRDIKPGNIQVLPDSTAKILDFGIARRDDSTLKTKTGLVMGTPNYMSPEQIQGVTVVDHRVDMWAVGVILYELLTGARPFESGTMTTLLYRIVHQPFAPLDSRKLGLSQDLIDVVDRCLAKEPNARFRDMAEMSAALRKSLGVSESVDILSDEARERGFKRNIEFARSLLVRGQPARALEAARRAQALEPSRAEVVKLIEEIESYLENMAGERTVALPAPVPPPKPVASDVDKWIDEARLALTAGNRTEALRIVEDVLALEPKSEPATELRELLQKPAAPGRAKTGQHRSYAQAEALLKRSLSFKEQVTFGEKTGPQVIAMAPHEEVVAAGGSDGSVRLWDLRTRSKMTTLRSGMHKRAGHEGLVTSLVFSEDGRFIASGHLDGAIHIWSLDTGDELRVRLGHEGSVGAIQFSPDGAMLASGGMDATLKLWDMSTLELGEARRRLIRQPAGVGSLTFAREGVWLVTGHANRILRVHDVSSGRLIATLRGHQAAVSYLTVSSDGNLLASGGQDRSVRLFDLQRRSEVKALEGHKRAISSIAFFPDGRHAASVAMEDQLIVWDLETGRPSDTQWGDTDEIFASVQVFAGGQQMACALTDGRIRVWMAS